MDDYKEKAVIFYTVLLAGLGVIVTIDITRQTIAFVMLIEGLFFAIVMYVAVKMPLLLSIFDKLKIKIIFRPKIKHRFELSKNNELSLYIHNPKRAKDIHVLYQFKKFADYKGEKYEKKYRTDLRLLNHLHDGTSDVLLEARLVSNDTRKIEIGIYQNGKLSLFFGDALLTGFRDGTFEYIVGCFGEYRGNKFTEPDFSVWLTIKDGVIKMVKEL